MKYYPTLLHLPADAMPETPPVGNHSYTVKPAGCCKIMVKLDNSSFVVKGLGQSQKFGFGVKFYVGSADDLPLSERVMPGLVAVAWAEAQVLARKWQQKKDSEQPDVLPSCDATTEPSPKDASSGSKTTLASGVQTTAPPQLDALLFSQTVVFASCNCCLLLSSNMVGETCN